MGAVDVQAMLCDYAEVAGGKLFITGANINLIGTPVSEPPLRVSLALAMIITIPWTATNQPHTLTVELVSDQASGNERVRLTDQPPPSGDEAEAGLIVAQFNAGRSPIMKPGEDNLLPIALPMLGLPLPRPGGYFFVIRIDGTEMRRVPFRLESQVAIAGMMR